jgi:CRISPR-associated protein Csd1
MLLKALYELAHSRKLLDDLAFNSKAVRWVIQLDANGNFLGIVPTGDDKRGKEFSAPQTTRPKVAGGVAEFLADGITAVFGFDSDPEKDKDNEKRRRDRDQNNAAKQMDFWQQIEAAFTATQHSSLQALLHFKEQHAAQPQFLRWGHKQDSEGKEKPAWWLTTAEGSEVKLAAENFTFSVNGQLLLEDEQTIRPFWRKVYQQEVGAKNEAVEKGLCLITGQTDVPIAPTHNPKIKGVPNAQPTGAAIVSFDKAAFTSYGCDQSYNAPASIEASTAYSVALNWLINQRTHNFRLGGTIICFWARNYEESTADFFTLFDQPKPETIKKFLASPLRGEERSAIAEDEFYSVTLAGNAGRIVVRHWLQVPLATAKENLQQWFRDLDIAPYGEPSAAKKKNDEETSSPLGLYRLAMTTVRESKDLQPEILTQLYRAALEAHAPSLQLLKPVLNRLAKQLVKDGPNTTLRNLSRFALIRLIVNRNRKEGEPFMETKVCETSDAAYNCGRLLAIFDDLQMRAHDFQLEGAGVVERYYGAASSAPNSAFGILWRLHQHHLKKVSRGGDRGKAAAEAIKRRIAEIAALFPQPAPLQPPQFPRTFSLVEQGRFALGFYQQKAADDAARKEAKTNRNQSQPASQPEVAEVNTPALPGF